MKTGRPPTPLATRFWAKVDRNGPIVRLELGPCWIWTGAHGHKGHGRMRDAGSVMVQASAVSYRINVGPTRGLCVLHCCDNPPCVRPDHLFLGTRVDNVEDMDRKGRRRPPTGEAHGNSKLSDGKVREMRLKRAQGVTFKELAREFGVNVMTAHRAATGKGWRHVCAG